MLVKLLACCDLTCYCVVTDSQPLENLTMEFIHGVIVTIAMTAVCAFIIGLVYVAELIRIGAY